MQQSAALVSVQCPVSRPKLFPRHGDDSMKRSEDMILTYIENAIINAMIKRKRPLTVKQIHGIILGSKESAVKATIDQLLADNMIRDPKGDGHYVITISGWNAWEAYSDR